MRTARYAALGTIDAADGSPSVSRVSLATTIDGSPGFFISRLSSHFANLESDARCSILAGEPGKGDPLAHPRITLIGRARKLADDEREAFASRYILRHPKAALYAGFPDFAYWVLDIDRASLNGGFGKAFAMTRDDIVSSAPALAGLAAIEAGAVAHMNSDHKDAVDKYAREAGGEGEGWQLACLDAEGVDLTRGDRCVRLWFDEPLAAASDLRTTLVSLARR